LSNIIDRDPEMGVDAGAVKVFAGSTKRRCGDFGGLRMDGTKCEHPIPAGRERCPWHPADVSPEEAAKIRRDLAAKGGRNSREPRRAHGSAPDPKFDAPDKIIRWAEKTAGGVLRGELTDYRSIEAALKLARLALDSLGVKALEQLDQLEALVRNRLQRGAPA